MQFPKMLAEIFYQLALLFVGYRHLFSVSHD